MGETVVRAPTVRLSFLRMGKHLLILFRPYLHIYAHSNEVEELAVINLIGVNLERQEHMEALLGVRIIFTFSVILLR